MLGDVHVFDNAISIHAPCEGSDSLEKQFPVDEDGFQSTLPAKGATGDNVATGTTITISIHAPCEGSDPFGKTLQVSGQISIHAPCEGSDGDIVNRLFRPMGFQSTLPAKGATRFAAICGSWPINFNPRSLRRERHWKSATACGRSSFQSTLPAKGATSVGNASCTANVISIHAPCEGSDGLHTREIALLKNFNPRSLRRERLQTITYIFRKRDFNPRSLRRERHGSRGAGMVLQNFNPRSLRRERPHLLDQSNITL